MHKFEQNVAIDIGIAPAAAYTNAEKAGENADMAKFNNYCAAILVGSKTQYQGALTCVIAESTDGSTYSDTFLATVTLASSTTTDQVDSIEIRAEQMSAGYRFLRCEITPAAGTVNLFSVVNMRFNPRFANGAAL